MTCSGAGERNEAKILMQMQTEKAKTRPSPPGSNVEKSSVNVAAVQWVQGT